MVYLVVSTARVSQSVPMLMAKEKETKSKQERHRFKNCNYILTIGTQPQQRINKESKKKKVKSEAAN
jgi:hypothetical protein